MAITPRRRLVLRLASRFKRWGVAVVAFRDIDEATQPGSEVYPLWLQAYGQHEISRPQIARLVNSVNAELASMRAEVEAFAGVIQ